MNIPSLAGCLNKIAGTVAAVPIKLYKREDDRMERLESCGLMLNIWQKPLHFRQK